MFKALPVFTVLLCAAFSATAQIKRLATFEVDVADTANSVFFTQSVSVNKATLYYTDGKLNTITLHFAGNVLNYNMAFVGDRYLLSKQYPQFVLLELPAMRVTYLADAVYPNKNTLREYVTAQIKVDSVCYRVSYYSYQPGDIFGPMDAGIPKYKGDKTELALQIGKLFKANPPKAMGDSVFIFQGIVQRNGAINNMQLISGVGCSFTTEVIKQLPQIAKWLPALQGGTPVKVDAKIYVKLNADGGLIVLPSA